METCEFREWDELLPDALGLIFKSLSLEELLTITPTVCKSWRKVVMGPCCWQEIDIEEWSENSLPENIDRMVQMLVMRSCGSFQKLSVSGLSNDASFSLIADHAKALQTLRLPSSEISNSIVEQEAWKLSAVTFVDLSHCMNIGAGAIEAIGKHCKFLTRFHRNMNPWDTVDDVSRDDEALAVAATMPKLQHLEMAHLLVNTQSILEILSKCQKLESLDIVGCWNVYLEEKVVKEFSGVKVVGPYGMNGWDDCSRDFGVSGYMTWDFVAGEMDDYFDFDDGISDIEWEEEEDEQSVENMWFYDAADAAEYEWP